MLLPPTLDGQRKPEESFGHWFTLIFEDDTCVSALFIDHGNIGGEGQRLVFEVLIPSSPTQRTYNPFCLMEGFVDWMDGDMDGYFQFEAFNQNGDTSKNTRYRIHDMPVRRIIQGVIPHG